MATSECGELLMVSRTTAHPGEKANVSIEEFPGIGEGNDFIEMSKYPARKLCQLQCPNMFRIMQIHAYMRKEGRKLR